MLLTRPRKNGSPQGRIPRGGRRRGRCGKKFEIEIQPSRSDGKLKTPEELAVSDALDNLGVPWVAEGVAFRILKKGKNNGQHGLFVPDFYAGGVFIEVSSESRLDEKDHKIRFLRERYQVVVLHLTPDLVDKIQDDAQVLERLIAETAAATLRIGGDARRPAITAALTATHTNRANKRRRDFDEQRAQKRKATTEARNNPFAGYGGRAGWTPSRAFTAAANAAKLGLRAS